MTGEGTAHAAAAAAAAARAIKASGAIVQVEPYEFQRLVEGVGDGLVIVAEGGVFRRHYRYLTSYRGFVFVTKSPDQLVLPHRTERMLARKVWIPD